jgi:hypothetical protein
MSGTARPRRRCVGLVIEERPPVLEARSHTVEPQAPGRASGARYISIDFWRGFALITIFINHIPGNLFEAYTHKNFGFSDAAELFVLLAGITAACAYMPGFVATPARAVVKIGLRAWTLYMAHLTTLALCGAIVACAVLITEDTRLLEATQFDQIMGNPLSATIGVATLGLQPAYMNILPLYIVLLAMAPAVMSLIRVSPPLALALSGALYVVAQTFTLTLPAYPMPEAWYFNPLAWQFLFVAGLCLGARISAGRPVAVGNVLLAASMAYVLAALVWWRMGWIVDLSPLPRFLWDFDKTNLSLPRLLHVLALACIVSRLPFEALLRRAAFGRPFVLLGRHSLPVFCAGTVLGMVALPVRASELGHPALDLLIIPGGIVLQLALAWVLEWYRGTPSTSSQRAVAAPAPDVGRAPA